MSQGACAVAIVNSKTSNQEACTATSVGIFRLTDPPGVGLIMECTEPGFHVSGCTRELPVSMFTDEDAFRSSLQPHKAAALYTDADTPAGHVQKGTADHFEIIDLRPVHER